MRRHITRTLFILIVPITIAIAAAAVVIVLLNQPTLLSRHYNALGTEVEITICVPRIQRPHTGNAIQRAYVKIQRLDRMANAQRSESDISHINRAAGNHPATVHPETIEMLEYAQHISELSDGAFDITLGAVKKLWRFDQANPRIPGTEEIQAALPLVNYRNVVINREASTVFLPQPGMAIDLGEIAKGTAVDWTIKALKREGITNALVKAGGNFYAQGRNVRGRPWRVGVHHPRNPHESLTRLAVLDHAVATLADYDHMVIINGKKYHHILDPRTGYPADQCMSVTIIHPSAAFADAIATAVFVRGPESGLQLVERLPDTEALIAAPDDTVVYSSGYGALFGR